jgi:hypothetical protein
MSVSICLSKNLVFVALNALGANYYKNHLFYVILLGQISCSTSLRRLDSRPEDSQEILHVPLSDLFFLCCASRESSFVALPSLE